MAGIRSDRETELREAAPAFFKRGHRHHEMIDRTHRLLFRCHWKTPLRLNDVSSTT